MRWLLNGAIRRCALGLWLVCLGSMTGCHPDSGSSAGDAALADAATADLAATADGSAAILKTCALVQSCSLWPFPASVSGCVRQFEQGLGAFLGTSDGSAHQFRVYVECGRTTSTCDDLKTCVARNPGADDCTQSPGAACDGELLTHCGSANITVDCSAMGEHCRTGGPNNSAVCTNGVSCKPGVPDLCDGNRFVQCDPFTSLQSSIDCGALSPGATCGRYVYMGSNGDSCTPPGPACNGPFGVHPLRCDGNRLVECIMGHEHPVDCATFEGHCTGNGLDSSACVPDANDCTVATPERCNGNALQACVNGKIKTIDCTSIGFRTCVTTPASIADMGGSPARTQCMP